MSSRVSKPASSTLDRTMKHRTPTMSCFSSHGNPIYVSVECPFGCGKSSFIRHFSSLYQVPGLVHSIELVEMFQKFQAYPRGYAVALQNALLQEASSSLLPKRGLFLGERSPDSAKHVFSPLLRKDGHLSVHTLEFFTRYADKMPIPRAMIFLDASEEVCRQRLEEQLMISAKDVAVVRAAYRLYQHEKENSSMPILCLNTSNLSLETCVDQAAMWLQGLLESGKLVGSRKNTHNVKR